MKKTKKSRDGSYKNINETVPIVIIGASTAAVAAVGAIRETGDKTPVTVVSREECYSRPLISYYLEGKIKDEDMLYCPGVFGRGNGVEGIFGVEVNKIDSAKKTVLLKNGKKLAYSKLLVATGGRPFIPAALAKELSCAGKSVFTFTKLDDVLKIKDFTASLKNKTKNAVIIGGGMIGIKAAGALKHLGFGVTIIELSDRILGNVFDTVASEIAVSHLRENGVNVELSDTVVKATCKKLKLKSGKELPADIIVAAIGVVPDLEIVKGTGIKTNRGITVDEHMQTSVNDIYAAGDVTETLDTISGETRAMAIWPLAHRQGRIAGSNMASVEKKYDGGFMMNSVDILGLPVITIGASAYQAEGCEVILDINKEKKSYKKIIIKDNVIIGAIFVNDIDRAGIITGLMKDKMDVSSFKKDILGEKFGYIYVPKEYRSQKAVPVEI